MTPSRFLAHTTNRRLFSSQASLFGDLLANMRYKAADALTASLSKDEQTELLDRWSPVTREDETANKKKNDEVHDNIQKSIAEAVAEARALDAQKHSQQRKEHEATLQAERAARERVANELKIQKQRMEFAKWEQARIEAQSSTTESSKEAVEASSHPVLGPVVADLGHKQIYTVPAATLATIPIWKKQRIYRHDRAKNMAQDKLKTLHLGLPGIIGLHQDKDGRLSIIDGQHRVGMISILQEKQVDLDLERVLVEVYLEDDFGDSHAQDLFLEVNKAEPVKLVDMPGVAQKSVRNVISVGAQRLADRFPAMFKPSQRCRSPHLNIDNLRDALFASNVLKRHGIASGAALETHLLEQNESLKLWYAENESDVPQRALAKAREHGFYLGLQSEWMYK